jgi:hypothetical protein
MSFQLTFLGYYPIKSQQLKKQTHSVKMRNWSHRERTAPDGRQLRTASGGRGSRPPPPDGLEGQPQRPLDSHPFRRSEGGRPPPSTSRGGRRPRRPLGGRLADAEVDVWMHDNPISLGLNFIFLELLIEMFLLLSLCDLMLF